ncbi:MAG: hypothetical protein QM478_13795 [Flavobacteriaceae bacterium]
MKKLALLCIVSLSFISCDQIIGDIISNAIENSIDNSDPDFDTFVEIENTSNFQINNLQFYFDANNTYHLSHIHPTSVTNNHMGFYSITNSPTISFYINNQYYETRSINSSTHFEHGQYLLKIRILSLSSNLFTYELIEVDN